jgi:hypothetical protein
MNCSSCGKPLSKRELHDLAHLQVGVLFLFGQFPKAIFCYECTRKNEAKEENLATS